MKKVELERLVAELQRLPRDVTFVKTRTGLSFPGYGTGHFDFSGQVPTKISEKA